MLSAMFDVEGFVLVGGASRRMGTDKARLVLGGLTQVKRVAAAMAPVVRNVRVVGSHSAAEGFPNVPDIQPGWGPLNGIHSALAATHCEWALVVACDLPFVTTALLARLCQLANQRADTCDALVPIQPDGWRQGLCALYRREPCHGVAADLVSRDEHTPRALFEAVRISYVQFSEISDLEGSEYFFFNVNTPENYQKARQILAAAGST
jgi:molybdopterin-guanine dinucleotide biosynthesis protein A